MISKVVINAILDEWESEQRAFHNSKINREEPKETKKKYLHRVSIKKDRIVKTIEGVNKIITGINSRS